MYNTEIKRKFIRNYTTSVATSKVCETLFNFTETFEREWGDDLCTKTTEELQPLSESLVGIRTASKNMRIIILKDYVRWCINVEHYPKACDGMLNVKPTGIEKIRQQTVANPLSLQMYLNLIYKDESEQGVDNIYRCYYWLAYAGIPEDDLLSVKISDVDFNKMVIKYRNTTVPIYRESVPAFKNCVELTSFSYNHPGYSKTIIKDRAAGDSLIRGYSDSLSILTIRTELSRRSKKCSDKTDVRLGYYRTWLSGVFYRVHEKEVAGLNPDFTDIVAEHMDGKSYKLDTNRSTSEYKHNRLINEYKEDYCRWKIAHNI